MIGESKMLKNLLWKRSAFYVERVHEQVFVAVWVMEYCSYEMIT
jgi:hypothetical protein